MKTKLMLCFLMFTISFSYAQFDGTWDFKLTSDHHTETIVLKQNGNKITGTLKDGGKFNANYDKSNNKLTGYFRYNRKMHKIKASIKNNTNDELIVGKYCACSGEPNKVLSFKKQKTYNSADWRKAEETVRNQNAKSTSNNSSTASSTVRTTTRSSALEPTRRRRNRRSSHSTPTRRTRQPKPVDYSGRYRVTITNLYTHTSESGLFETHSEIYGLIGLRFKGQSNSTGVTIKAMGNKKPRIWEVKSSNPVDVKQSGLNYPTVRDPKTGVEFIPKGKYEIDKIREYNIQGELANSKLQLNIQTNLKDSNVIRDTDFGWKQRNIFIKDMKLGKEYIVISKRGENKVAVGFMLEKL